MKYSIKQKSVNQKTQQTKNPTINKKSPFFLVSEIK